MQIRIKQSNSYSPLHEAKPLEELDTHEPEQLIEPHAEEIEHHSWKTSKKVVIGLFVAALAIFGVVIFVADEFNESEMLSAIRVEGNRWVTTSEIVSLAKIDRSKKFYDMDLRTIAARIEQYPVVRHVAIEREVNPNTIVIRVEERQPRAMVIADSGEPAIIDAEYQLFWPKRLSGLQDPEKLLSAPMLSGVSSRDTATLHQMTDLLTTVQAAEEGSMQGAIAELKRMPSGAFVLYTSETMTPIYLGSPAESAFHTALETEQGLTHDADRSLFTRQVQLLSTMWRKHLQEDLRKKAVRYIDARFAGQIIVKTKS